MGWQKHPKSRKSIRILQPKTMEIKSCPTFPEIEGGHSVTFFDFKATTSNLIAKETDFTLFVNQGFDKNFCQESNFYFLWC